MASTTAQIRDYEAKDAFEIVLLFYETVREVNRADYSREQLEAWAPEIPDHEAWHIRMCSRYTLVAEENSEIIGFAELEDDGHLDMLYCRKDAVNRGVGSMLYRAVESKARDLDLARIFTEASITARPFFERHGFHTLHRLTVVVRDIAMTNFAMEKPLRLSG